MEWCIVLTCIVARSGRFLGVRRFELVPLGDGCGWVHHEGYVWGFFFFSSRRRHTRCSRDWSSDVCSSDLAAVGSVVGIGAFAGGIGGWAFQRVTGRILQASGNDYTPIFIVCGLAYVAAWTIIHFLAPRLEPAATG